MIDLRILALGVLALLLAAYGATSSRQTGRGPSNIVVQSQPSIDQAARTGDITGSVGHGDHVSHVDGFDLRR